MTKTINQVLSADNLCGQIQGVVGGVPKDIIPPSFLTPTRSISGNVGRYTRVDGNRQTARLVQYGAPSVKRGLQGISEVPIKLMHTFEHQSHTPDTLINLTSETSEAKQRLGAETVGRQVKVFGDLFTSLRMSAIYSMLSYGAIYFDGPGNLLYTSGSAVTTIDYGVPAANKSQLNWDAGGDIISADWDDAGTDIGAQIRDLKASALQLTGYPIVHAFYGSSIPAYLLGNTAVKALIAGSANLADDFAKGNEIPNGLFGLQWHPVCDAFFADADGTNRSWFAYDKVVFTPEPSTDWYELVQGSYAVPTSLGLTGDAIAALGNLKEVFGPFSYAELTTDPPGIKHLAGDTFLPVLKVPKAIFIADVKAS